MTLRPFFFISIAKWHTLRRRAALRFFAIIVSLVFLFPHLNWAFEAQIFQGNSSPFLFNNQIINIPAKLGSVTESFQGGQNLVIHVQDLHCNYEVQQNIAQMIDCLSKKHKLALVGIEGASLPINVNKLSTFPDQAVKQEVGEHFMRQGRISGPELYAAVGRHKISLEGVEKASNYALDKEYVSQFLNSESQGYIYDLRETLEQIKPGIYSPRLRKHDKPVTAFKQGEIPLLEYALLLFKSGRKQGFLMDDYPQLRKYVSRRLQVLPLKVDADKLLEEIEALERRLRAGLYTSSAQQELDELLSRLEIMEKLVNISASPQNLAEFRYRPENFRVELFMRYLAQQNPEYGPGLNPEVYRLDHYLNLVKDFYQVADQRSLDFVVNLRARMKNHQTNLAMLVTGGYHTPEILGELRRQNISFISVKPRLRQLDNINPYFSLLQNKKTPLEKLLAQNQNLMALGAYFVEQGKNLSKELMIAYQYLQSCLILWRLEKKAARGELSGLLAKKLHLSLILNYPDYNPKHPPKSIEPQTDGSLLVTLDDNEPHGHFALIRSERLDLEFNPFQQISILPGKGPFIFFYYNKHKPAVTAAIASAAAESTGDRLENALNLKHALDEALKNAVPWGALIVPAARISTQAWPRLEQKGARLAEQVIQYMGGIRAGISIPGRFAKIRLKLLPKTTSQNFNLLVLILSMAINTFSPFTTPPSAFPDVNLDPQRWLISEEGITRIRNLIRQAKEEHRGYLIHNGDPDADAEGWEDASEGDQQAFTKACDIFKDHTVDLRRLSLGEVDLQKIISGQNIVFIEPQTGEKPWKFRIRDCHSYQIAFSDREANCTYIDKYIWDALTTEQRAALLAHHAIELYGIQQKPCLPEDCRVLHEIGENCERKILKSQPGKASSLTDRIRDILAESFDVIIPFADIVKKTNLDKGDLIKLIGRGQMHSIESLCKLLKPRNRILNINTTAKGGGVARGLPNLIALADLLGMEKVDWMVPYLADVAGTEDLDLYFEATKKMHVSMHDHSVMLNDEEKAAYIKVNEIITEMMIDKFKDYDTIIIHDPQPAFLISEIKKKYPHIKIIWRCHVDTSTANEDSMNMLLEYVNHANVAVFHSRDFVPEGLTVPAVIMGFSINPFEDQNRDLIQMSKSEVEKILSYYMGKKWEEKLDEVASKSFDPSFAVIKQQGVKITAPGEMGSNAAKIRNNLKETYAGKDFIALIKKLHGIDIDRPLFTQVSRFDPLKDPEGVLEAFIKLRIRLKRENPEEKPQLALVGELAASDDPGPFDILRYLNEYLEECLKGNKGYEISENEMKEIIQDIHIIINSINSSDLEANALVRGSLAVLQKSIKEGFGATVAEALIKRIPVIGGNVGGITGQIRNAKSVGPYVKKGENGYLVGEMNEETGLLEHSVEGAVDAMFDLVTHPEKAEEMGEAGRKVVLEDYLVTGHWRNYMTIFYALENPAFYEELKTAGIIEAADLYNKIPEVSAARSIGYSPRNMISQKLAELKRLNIIGETNFKQVLSKLNQLVSEDGLTFSLDHETYTIKKLGLKLLDGKEGVPAEHQAHFSETGAYLEVNGDTALIYVMPGKNAERAIIHEFLEVVAEFKRDLVVGILDDANEKGIMPIFPDEVPHTAQTRSIQPAGPKALIALILLSVVFLPNKNQAGKVRSNRIQLDGVVSFFQSAFSLVRGVLILWLVTQPKVKARSLISTGRISSTGLKVFILSGYGELRPRIRFHPLSSCTGLFKKLISPFGCVNDGKFYIPDRLLNTGSDGASFSSRLRQYLLFLIQGHQIENYHAKMRIDLVSSELTGWILKPNEAVWKNILTPKILSNWLTHPIPENSQAMANAIDKLLKPESLSSRAKVLSALSKLCASIPQLEGVKVGEWDILPDKVSRQEILLPSLLLYKENKAVLRKVLDILELLPVDLEPQYKLTPLRQLPGLSVWQCV